MASPQISIPYDQTEQEDALSIASSEGSQFDSDSFGSELSFESDSESQDASQTDESDQESASEASDESDDAAAAPTALKSKSKMGLLQFYDMHARQRVTVSNDHPYEIKVYRRKPGASGPKRSYQLVSTNADGKGLYKMISRTQAGELGYPQNASFA